MLIGYIMRDLFSKLIDPLRPHPVVRPPSQTGPFIASFLKPIRGLLVITLLISGIAATAEISMFAFLGKFVDWMNETPRDQFLDRHGLALIGMVVVVALIRPVALLISRALIMQALVPGITNTVRWQTHRYVLRQSLNYFQSDFAGRISQKVMQTGNAMREAVINVIDGIWLLVIYLIGVVVLFIDLDSRLLIPIGLWFAGYLIVARIMVPPVRERSAALSESTSRLTGRIVDSYTNIQSVKLFADPDREDQFAADAIDNHTTSLRSLMNSILSMTVLLTILNTALIVWIATQSIFLWMNEALTVGAIAIANGLIIRLTQMSAWILRTITSLFENIGTIQNGIETISQKTSVVDHPDATTLHVPRGQIVFDRVSFTYSEKIPAIRELDLTIAPGEKVGIVGRSGAGKSTLVNLLLRFYDIDSGMIRIDDTDIATVSQASLRREIAMVTQDTSLLHRSIADNIRYGREDASDAEVIAAATAAAADIFIPDLVDPQGRTGYDAYVGERGVKLSGGQRQRVAIARVILKNAPILILDEATSALDSEVEAVISDQLAKLMEGKSVLAIAHRLSTIAALDRLIVMDEGRIIETGSHAELIAAGGLYASLWSRQSGGFLGMEESVVA